MATATRTRGHKTRKAGTATVPTPAIHFNSNAAEDNLTARRVQRLVDTLGITERRARVFADLAWEAAHG